MGRGSESADDSLSGGTPLVGVERTHFSMSFLSGTVTTFFFWSASKNGLLLMPSDML